MHLPCNSFHARQCRVLLTDLESLNGTWVNRAQLRPHADCQIQAQDVIAFGSSDATFQLVAIDAAASKLPTALETANAMLQSSSGAPEQDLGGPDGSQHQSSNEGLLVQHGNLVAQYQGSVSRLERSKCMLQVGAHPLPLMVLCFLGASKCHCFLDRVTGESMQAKER